MWYPLEMHVLFYSNCEIICFIWVDRIGGVTKYMCVDRGCDLFIEVNEIRG